MNTNLAMGKTKDAMEALKKINPGLFKKFVDIDLEKLRKKSTPQLVIEHAEKKDGIIYKYAVDVCSSVNNAAQFKKAIELQSKSLGTSSKGLFYKLIFQYRQSLFKPETKSKVKAFLLATSEKDKEIKDKDVSVADKDYHRMNKFNIVQKLNSSRPSNVLKVFMALVAWDCILIKESSPQQSDSAETATPKVNVLNAKKDEQKTGQTNGKEDNKEQKLKTDEEPPIKTQEPEKVEDNAVGEEDSKKEGEKNAEKLADERRQDISSKARKSKINHDDYIKKFNEMYKENFSDGDKFADVWASMGLYSKETLQIYDLQYPLDMHLEVKGKIKEFGENEKLAKDLYGELLWLSYSAYSRDPSELIIDVFNALSKKAVIRNKSLFLAFKEVYGNVVDIFPETLEILGAAKNRFRDSNSLHKMTTALQTIQRLYDELEPLKAKKEFKILAEAWQKLVIQPILNELKSKIDKKKAEQPKEKRSFDEESAKKKDGASKGGRYIPYTDSAGKSKQAGKGKFGVVLVYWDTLNKTKVAIKTKGGKPFKDVEKLMRIRSKYIAEIYGTTTLIIDGKEIPGMVMEYVHGKNSFINEVYRLSANSALGICKQLVTAFQDFEQAGYVHSDLDTHFENILIDKGDNIKIIDYDLDNDQLQTRKSNQQLATEQILSVLEVNHRGLLEKFLAKFPGMEIRHPSQVLDHKIALSDSSYIPRFGELMKALDQLKSAS